MLLNLTLPASWRLLLDEFRPVFARSSTFGLFVVLATGLVARTTRRTVVGMLAGAGMAAVVSFHSACRFFSAHVWDPDRLGLALARLLLPGEPILMVIDDSLFRRWGKKVHGAYWTHDGAAQGPAKIGRGNRWVIAGIVVALPFCSHPVCLPVLHRLGREGHRLPGRAGRADVCPAHSPVPGQAPAWGRGCGLQGCPAAGARQHLDHPATDECHLYALAPQRTGKRGRPALKGHKLGKPHQVAASATWRRVKVHRYGRTDTVHIAEAPCIWYGPFGNTPGRIVLVREPGSAKPYDLALFTTDRDTAAEHIVACYADRWTIEVAIATGKQILGVGQARNRLRRAVERTVPFAFCVQTLVTVWYATSGYHPDDLAARLAAEPWYDKTEPAFEDMLAKLRRTLIAARFTPATPAHIDPHIIHDYALACVAAAA